jgi:S-methylmethionine-dependent homocysteine/selenocysteine methylase
MSVKYRNKLPQVGDAVFLTDGGIETTLIFNEGLELPHFAAFHLLKDRQGTEALRKYFRTYADIARRYGVGFIYESPTWRANRDWGAKLGYSEKALADVNRLSVDLVGGIREEFGIVPTVISGCVGPRGDGYNPTNGDGYNPTNVMSAGEAEEYHSAQIRAFSETDADLVTAITMNYIEEAIGIARAASNAGMPVVISFTVETNGKLPTGHTLGEAIRRVDDETDGAPAYYMVNCAHPTHFEDALDDGKERIRGVRANASRKSHAELNDSVELDIGDPAEFGRDHHRLSVKLPKLNVIGGCCGTDHRHVEEICKTCFGPQHC